MICACDALVCFLGLGDEFRPYVRHTPLRGVRQRADIVVGMINLPHPRENFAGSSDAGGHVKSLVEFGGPWANKFGCMRLGRALIPI